MTTNTQAGDEELNHIEDMIVAYGRLPTQSNRKRIMQLIKSKQLEARIESAQYIQDNFVSPAGGYCDEISPTAIPDYIEGLNKGDN